MFLRVSRFGSGRGKASLPLLLYSDLSIEGSKKDSRLPSKRKSAIPSPPTIPSVENHG